MALGIPKFFVSIFLLAGGGAVVAGKTLYFGVIEESEVKTSLSQEINDGEDTSGDEETAQREEKFDELAEEEGLVSVPTPVTKESEDSSVSSEVPTLPKNTCTIYVTDTPTPNYGDNRTIKKLMKKFEGLDVFLSGEARNSKDSFKDEVRRECGDAQKHPNLNVYVWKTGGIWYYSGSIQKDWLNNAGIIRSFK